MVMPDDSVIGANITRGAVRAGAPVGVTKWRLDNEGKFSSANPISLTWGYQTPIGRCVARVGPGGGVAVLMADEAGQWALFDNSGESLPLPADVGKSLLPRDVVFYSEGELALIVGRMTQGFEVMMSDGSPLPRR